MADIEPCISEAIETIEHFITEVTGQAPTREELARTLKHNAQSPFQGL